ncbi:MAG: MBL fold metallo-hydrolase [Methanomicrobium sp.]|nr:MBL fold metallo-hydrolase [Methanomicrobium sp.]
MKLTVLCDNNTITDLYLAGEPALSFFIEDSGKNILFDAGYSDVFIKNAEKIGINLLLTDFIVLSHGHIDHTGGLLHLKKMYKKAISEGIFHKRPCLIAHPAVFRDVSEESFGNIGSPVKKEDLELFADVVLSDEPFKITENLIFLGQIREKTSFESPSYAGVSKNDAGDDVPDCSPDDSALVYFSETGLVVITGCSHSGICSIVKQAENISGRNDFIDIIGGFHLLNAEKERLLKTGEFLKNLDIKKIHPCHCTDLCAKIALSAFVETGDVGSGFVIEL